ncbi:MAG: hypothetical protein JO170_11410 [Verrucomicrobia bacterium]|nr:hypothetical protein [Verrucomicrobiota bacterium]
MAKYITEAVPLQVASGIGARGTRGRNGEGAKRRGGERAKGRKGEWATGRIGVFEAQSAEQTLA